MCMHLVHLNLPWHRFSSLILFIFDWLTGAAATSLGMANTPIYSHFTCGYKREFSRGQFRHFLIFMGVLLADKMLAKYIHSLFESPSLWNGASVNTHKRSHVCVDVHALIKKCSILAWFHGWEPRILGPSLIVMIFKRFQKSTLFTNPSLSLFLHVIKEYASIGAFWISPTPPPPTKYVSYARKNDNNNGRYLILFPF